jgi:hypothetical protein
LHSLHFIIQQVEHFYGEAWNTLLWEVGLITAALGVVAPLVIGWNRTRTLRKAIDAAEKRIDAHRGEMEDLRQSIRDSVNGAKADALTINSLNLPALRALDKLLMAAALFAEAGDYLGATTRLSDITSDQFINRLRGEDGVEGGEILEAFNSGAKYLDGKIHGRQAICQGKDFPANRLIDQVQAARRRYLAAFDGDTGTGRTQGGP